MVTLTRSYVSLSLGDSSDDSDPEMSMNPDETYQSILPYHLDIVKFRTNRSVLVRHPCLLFFEMIIWFEKIVVLVHLMELKA